MRHGNIEENNYANDPRVRALSACHHFSIVSETRGQAHVQLSEHIVECAIEDGIRPEDWNGEITATMRYEVCDLCEGRGSHTNPSIDCCGLSAEDFADDPDFAEDYMGGAYDVTCHQCHGQRVTPAIDLPEDLAKLIGEYDRSMAELRSCERAERMMGA